MHLSSEQRELIKKLDESLKVHSAKHAPREKGFLEGVRRFFSSSDEGSKHSR